MPSDLGNGYPVVWSIPVITIPPEDTYDLSPVTSDFDSSVYPTDVEYDATDWSDFNVTSSFEGPLNCSGPLQHVVWSDVRLLSCLLVLMVINCLVVAGNVLVILAVFSTPKLRTVTNLFIASLAVADLLLGLVVLPFSLTVEVFHTWLFGELWCSVWLAVDVWMSTASILNLCAISLDRYVAVTKPVKYPSKMTPLRAKLLIGGVWIFSFVVCFPPLVGWNDKHKNLSAGLECSLTCELTNDVGYVIYSALGSFFVPTFVMLFFYWKIYLAAAETTKAINQGFRSTRHRTQKFDEERVTLRIHVGRTNSVRSNEKTDDPKQRPFSSVKLPKHNRSLSARPKCTQKYSLDSSAHRKNKRNSADNPKSKDGLELLSLAANSKRSPTLHLSSRSCSTYSMDTGFSVDSTQTTPPSSSRHTSECNNGTSGTSGVTKRSTSKMGKRNIKVQVKRFRMETKAAKTLGIIVGVFIICWFPFFTMYVVRAFCADCIHPLLFSVLFWLGYCNSAINPCVYALFSKDFRLAFKKILCKCLCRRQPTKWPLPLPSMYLPSLGDDSDDDDHK